MEFKLVAIDEYHNHGSGVLKQERSDPLEDDDTRVSKMGKRADDLGLRSNSNNNNHSDKQQMLSFSSSNKPEVVGFLSNEDFRLVSDKNGFSFYNNSKTSTGFGSGNMNGGMNGSFTGIKGPFTPAQWIELEHQAMIYKYFTANVPVPSNLLIPIKKAIQYAGFTGFSIGSFPSHAYGWGSFHLGFSGNSDPEPGRCRRTDGKKWRCSRDAVPDQKYCERHINRGRHRSRKPVEGHTGQAASGATTTKVVPPMSSTMPSLVTPGGGVPNGIATAQHQIKGLQPAGASYASIDTKRLNDQHGLSMMPPPTANMESKDSRYPIPKHMEYDESSVSEFGIVSNDSLLNPSQKSSYVDCKRYNSMLDFNAQKNQEHNPLQHFTDNWPINPPHPSTIASPKDPKSDWTQLSMSIPMSTDFSSSSSSPNQENVSPSRLSRELEPSQMGLGVEIIVAEEGTKENSWIPIAYGNSMGGPLGEVLLNNSSAGLDNDEKTWDGSPQDGSSPTGILQKSTFVSISNNNSGGSPLGLV